jgi:predicted acyl esterase
MVGSLLAPGLLPAQEDASVVERAVPVRMRDGVVLFADVFRPARTGRFPVLLNAPLMTRVMTKELISDQELMSDQNL